MKYSIFAILLTGCGGSLGGEGLAVITTDAAPPETAATVAAEAPEASPEASAPEATTAAPDAAASPPEASSPMKSFPDAAVEACALVMHNDGLGQSWRDCTPARSPAAAQTACGGSCTLTDGYGGVCSVGISCTCWDPDGHVRAGSWPSGGMCNATGLATSNMWQ